jgi:hypothetical protein
MAPVTGYLAGEAPVVQNNPGHHSLKPHARLLASFTPRQKMILSIILAVICPAVFAILDLDELSPLAAILMPFAISFAVFYFRNQEKQLRAAASGAVNYSPLPIQVAPPAAPVYIPPSPAPVTSDTSNDTDRKLQLPPESLNGQIPLSAVPGSVTEEETRRLG